MVYHSDATAIAIIPARYHSTRFPGKPLALLKGKPVLQHVYENARRAKSVQRVIIATDHRAVFDAAASFGAEVQMTSTQCPSGSDRIAEVARTLRCDIVVNVQGDEPLVSAEMIDTAVGLLTGSDAEIGTLAKRIETPEEVVNPNTVKVVFSFSGDALYFSRSPIPYNRDLFTSVDGLLAAEFAIADLEMYKHIGLYSYRRESLLRLTELPQSRLECAEKLEQLRALENGYTIKVAVTETDTIGIDTPEELERVRQWLSLSS